VAHLPVVRRRSIRVALAATGIVAVAYVAVAAGVVAFTTRQLTAQIDARLTASFARLPVDGGDGDPPPGGHYDPGGDPDRPFGAPLLAWTIDEGDQVHGLPNAPSLPEDLYDVGEPTTAVVAGTELRLAGTRVGDDRVVVAQSMEQVSDAQRTIVFGELIIAPVLLGTVFLGAVAIGRRVAAPIEAAHRRQIEFTADASHELRTPLSVIEAHTTLALAQERDATWYRGAFQRVDRESKRMRRLLEDMLWLARFDAAQATPSAEPVDLGVLAIRAADRFAAVAETRQLDLRVATPPSQVVMSAAPDLLDRLLGVLLDNACKYAPEGGIVALTVGLDAGRATVTVDDSGPGVPEAERGQIFDRFHRASTTPADAGGAGLGLAIADAIVKATGGRWTIGTAPEGGARFSVSWPRAALG
jgi:signal transduction histidine kinase